MKICANLCHLWMIGLLLFLPGCGSDAGSAAPPAAIFKGVTFQIFSSTGKEIAAYAACPDDMQALSVSCRLAANYGHISAFYLDNNAGFCESDPPGGVIPGAGSAYLKAYVNCVQTTYDTGVPPVVTDTAIENKRKARRDQVLTDLGFNPATYP